MLKAANNTSPDFKYTINFTENLNINIKDKFRSKSTVPNYFLDRDFRKDEIIDRIKNKNNKNLNNNKNYEM